MKKILEILRTITIVGGNMDKHYVNKLIKTKQILENNNATNFLQINNLKKWIEVKRKSIFSYENRKYNP